MNNAWIIRPKPHGHNRLQDFLEKNIVGIGWPGIGKLSEIESKSDIWKRLEKVGCTENRSNRAIAQDVGTIYRFTKEMKKDDYVLVPNGSEIYIGKVLEDNPIYIKELDNDIDGFCHQRKIEWFFNKKNINKKVMTSRLYDSFKGQSTLFSTWFEDVEELIKNKSFLFIGTEYKNRHLDLKEKYLQRLNEGKIKGLNSNIIENICQKLLSQFFPGIERLGTNNTKGSGDTDLKATLLGGIVVRVQIKNFYKKYGQIEEWVVRQLAESMDKNDNGIILTTTTISEEARNLANIYSMEGKQISFIDRDEFVNLIFENIDIFNDEELIYLGLKKSYELL